VAPEATYREEGKGIGGTSRKGRGLEGRVWWKGRGLEGRAWWKGRGLTMEKVGGNGGGKEGMEETKCGRGGRYGR